MTNLNPTQINEILQWLQKRDKKIAMEFLQEVNNVDNDILEINKRLRYLKGIKGYRIRLTRDSSGYATSIIRYPEDTLTLTENKKWSHYPAGKVLRLEDYDEALDEGIKKVDELVSKHIA